MSLAQTVVEQRDQLELDRKEAHEAYVQFWPEWFLQLYGLSQLDCDEVRKLFPRGLPKRYDKEEAKRNRKRWLESSIPSSESPVQPTEENKEEKAVQLSSRSSKKETQLRQVRKREDKKILRWLFSPLTQGLESLRKKMLGSAAIKVEEPKKRTPKKKKSAVTRRVKKQMKRKGDKKNRKK